ncbi:hypothetical protein SAMN05216191_103337 [Paenibacillus jilunlii]|uniref:Uncharacterized protein n=1 Tax=Paenibacillus jilunlii TaxID=682956 RepID=A0A1G9KN39_9BACL|nr:hypothetical protein SAMN05216191_103337 [Paenibacillus jilunlii]
MKKAFLSVLFTAVLISSFSVTAFAAEQQLKVPLNHGVDY